MRLTRPNDAKPYSWLAAFALGSCWGAVTGLAAGFVRARHGFSFAVAIPWVLSGILLYAPCVHWASYRRWQRATNTPNDGR